LPFFLHRSRIAGAAGFLTGVRLAYWAGIAATLLWAPAAHPRPGNLLLASFDRWDARWLTRIAEHGYVNRQTAAFLPVYPLLVRGLAFVLRNHLAAGVVISLAAAAGSAVLLHRIARRHLPREAAGTAVVLLALYPAAFIFTAAYSDSVFLFFVLASIDAAERGSSLVAGLAGGLAVGTRLLGLALVPALAVLFWPSVRRLAAILLLPLALALWMLYTHVHYGDAFATFASEHRYWQRESLSVHALAHALHDVEASLSNVLVHLPSLAPGHRYPDWVASSVRDLWDFAFVVAGIALTVIAWRRFGAGLGLFSAATLAIVVGSPTTWEPFISIDRFLLADFPVLLALAALLERRPRLREAVLIGFAAVGAALAVGFSRGYLVV
jgi:hypothetical protein